MQPLFFERETYDSIVQVARDSDDCVKDRLDYLERLLELDYQDVGEDEHLAPLYAELANRASEGWRLVPASPLV